MTARSRPAGITARSSSPIISGWPAGSWIVPWPMG